MDLEHEAIPRLREGEWGVNAQLKLMPSANMQPNHGLPLASGLMVAPAGSLLCTEEGIVRLVIT
jgi:hypothetical protein